MFCIHCGAKLNDDAKFCSSCGKPVAGPVEETKATPAEAVKKETEITREKKGKEFWKKLSLKKLLILLCAVVVVILAVVLINSAVEKKKQNTILADIPDPEYFFGLSAEIHKTEIRNEYRFEYNSVTLEMAEAYATILTSGRYPFVQVSVDDDSHTGTAEKKKFSRTWKFDYNGEGEPWFESSWEIYVKYYYSDYYGEYIDVWVISASNFELVSAEHYTAEGVVAAPEVESGTVREDIGQNSSVQESPAPAVPEKEREPELVAGAISVENKIEAPKNAVPELGAWSNGTAESDRLVTKNDTIVEYDVSTSVVKEYLQALQDNGFTLADEYYFSYRGKTFQSWAFTCDAVPDAATITMQYEDTPCHVCVWMADDDDEYTVTISSSLQFCDTGLRRGGAVVDQVISGPSAGAGLLRLSDGSYQTTDGRLTAAAGTAMVVRDGKTYACDARWEVEKEDERLWVENYYRNEGFLFEVPKDSLAEGDLFLMSDLMRERYYVTEKAKFAGYNWHTPLFVIAYDGKWKGPELHGTDFDAVTVRIMYYQPGGEAVYYVYSKMRSAEPGEVEALVVVDMSVGSGGNFDNASRLKVGDKVTLNYTGEEFGAHYNLYDWTVTDGAGNVSIDASGDSCRVEALAKGVATVTVTYKYGVTEPDVLTGNPTRVGKSKTQSYNFIIE